jgi:hypothetical protein
MTCSITILSDLSQHHFSGRNRYLPFLLLFPSKRLPAPVVYLVGVKDSPFHYTIPLPALQQHDPGQLLHLKSPYPAYHGSSTITASVST